MDRMLSVDNLCIDELERYIKSHFKEGDIFKSKTELFNQIGLERIGVQSLKGGKQKNKAYTIVCQYMKLDPLKNGKHMLVCKEIYDVPQYIEKKDNRGRRGIYIDRTVPLLVESLNGMEEYVATVNEIAIKIGLIAKYISYDSNKDNL